MIEKYITIHAKNSRQPYHWHDLMELNLVLNGEMDIVLNNRKKHLRKGQLLLLNRDDVHCVESEDKDLLYIQMHFNMDLFNKFIPNIWNIYFTCGPDSTDVVSMELKREIKGFMANIYNMVKNANRSADYERKVLYDCTGILANLKLAFEYSEVSLSDHVKLPNDERGARLWEIFDYMYDNSSRKLTLKEVADHVYLSGPYMSTITKKYFGMNFEELLGFIRAEHSIRFLLNSDKSITEISYECGFSAPRYFNSTFKSIYNCLPAEYRERNRNYFKLEKENDQAVITYDDDLDIGIMENLLSKYTVEYLTDNPVESLEFDIGEKPKRTNTRRINIPVITCYEEEAIKTDTVNRVERCHKELGMNDVLIIGKKTRIAEIAAENLRRIGVTVEIREEYTDGCHIDKLIGANGIKKEMFYMYKTLQGVSEPFEARGENCYCYEDDNGYNIAVFNRGSRDYECTVSITGLESGKDYLLYKSTPPKFHTGVGSVVSRLSELAVKESRVLENMYEPDLAIEMARAEEPVVESITLKTGQATLITICTLIE